MLQGRIFISPGVGPVQRKGQSSNWASHPSGIGYRRVAIQSSGGSDGGSGGSTTIPGNLPLMDSGTSDGRNSDGAARLANFDSGGNENPNGPQPAPAPRAEQGTSNWDDPNSPLAIGDGASLAAILGLSPSSLQTPQLLPDYGSIPDNGNVTDLLERSSGNDAPAIQKLLYNPSSVLMPDSPFRANAFGNAAAWDSGLALPSRSGSDPSAAMGSVPMAARVGPLR